MYSRAIFILSFVLVLASCSNKKKAPAEQQPDYSGRYFSIILFAMDQWSTYHGQPFTLTKIVTENGKVDSSYVSALSMDWGNEVMKPFFASDISDKKYLFHYNFSEFDDSVLVTHTYTYEAIDDTLFTRRLYITTDPDTRKILSIYIETRKTDGPKEEVQKLLYKPVKLIQIQQFARSSVGLTLEKQVEYRF